MEKTVVVIDEAGLAKVIFDCGFLPVLRADTLVIMESICDDEDLELAVLVGGTAVLRHVAEVERVCAVPHRDGRSSKRRASRYFGSPKFGSS